METKELLRIIKACRANGVDEFALGELKISFSSDTLIPKNPRRYIKESKQMELIADKEEHHEALKELEEETQNLILTDPLAFEEKLASGELVDDPRLQH